MPETLAKSANSIQTALDEKGIEAQVVVLDSSARTAIEAASAIGCEVSQIAKSLIFKTKDSHKPVLVLASGPNRVDEKLIKSYLEEEIVKADADFTREVTGFAIGGIPPIGHKQEIEYIFIDKDLLTFESLWAAAGTPHAVFSLKGSDLVEMTNGKVVAVK